jgi:hypothetical protein
VQEETCCCSTRLAFNFIFVGIFPMGALGITQQKRTIRKGMALHTHTVYPPFYYYFRQKWTRNAGIKSQVIPVNHE